MDFIYLWEILAAKFMFVKKQKQNKNELRGKYFQMWNNHQFKHNLSKPDVVLIIHIK